MMGWKVLLGLVMAVSFARSTFASELGPTRPSDLVLLTNQNGTACGQGGRVFDTLIRSDGSFQPSPYAIPPGRVLVVTRVQWDNATLPANETFRAVFLYSREDPGGTTAINGFGNYFAKADAQGRFSTNFDIGPIAVKSGVRICAETTEPGYAPGIIRVFGFLARDR
jgi:hypothetical protein